MANEMAGQTMRPGEFNHPDLFWERLTPEQDPSIPTGHKKTVIYPVPVFWVDGNGKKKFVVLDAVEGAEDGNVTFSCIENSMQSSCSADGWVTAGCIDGKLRYRLKKQKHTRIGPPDWVELPDVAAISGFSKNANTINTVRGDIEIQTAILPGSLKDTIAIKNIPSNVDRTQPVGVVLEYQSALNPVKIGEEIHWQDGAAETILRWKAPVGWDANQEDIPLKYEMGPGAGEITLETLGGVDGLTLPLYFDPTTTTGFADGVRATCVRDTSGTSDFEHYHSLYCEVTAVSIGTDTLTAATMQWIGQALSHVGGSGPFSLNVDVFCDDNDLVGLTPANLGALSWSAKTESTTVAHSISPQLQEFDIFGAVGVNGASEIYDVNGIRISTFIFWTDATPEDFYSASNDNFIRIGRPDTFGRIQFYNNTHVVAYPRVELVHVASGQMTVNLSPQGAIDGGAKGFLTRAPAVKYSDGAVIEIDGVDLPDTFEWNGTDVVGFDTPSPISVPLVSGDDEQVNLIWETTPAEEPTNFVPVDIIGNETLEQLALNPTYDIDSFDGEVFLDALNAILLVKAKSAAGGSITFNAPLGRLFDDILLQDRTFQVGELVSILAIESGYFLRNGFVHLSGSNVLLQVIRPPFCY